MKAMLEPRIVTINTHGPLQVCGTACAGWANDSSHGDLIGIVIRNPSQHEGKPAQAADVQPFLVERFIEEPRWQFGPWNALSVAVPGF
ncbi:MAG: hypothetical protein WBQ79_12170 [Acidobacteriaceae bacterium]